MQGKEDMGEFAMPPYHHHHHHRSEQSSFKKIRPTVPVKFAKLGERGEKVAIIFLNESYCCR